MMKKGILFLLSVWLAIPVLAQDKPETVPQISAVENLALQKLSEDYQRLTQSLAQIQQQITQEHPGYTLNPQAPFSGTLVKIAKPAEKPVEKPAEKK